MKISIVRNDGTRIAAQHTDGVDFVLIAKCPNQACGIEPCKVKGDGRVTHDRNTYRVRAVAQCCTDDTQIVDIGVMEIAVGTIFGIDEDIAIGMRCRIYGGVQ